MPTHKPQIELRHEVEPPNFTIPAQPRRPTYKKIRSANMKRVTTNHQGEKSWRECLRPVRESTTSRNNQHQPIYPDSLSSRSSRRPLFGQDGPFVKRAAELLHDPSIKKCNNQSGPGFENFEIEERPHTADVRCQSETSVQPEIVRPHTSMGFLKHYSREMPTEMGRLVPHTRCRGTPTNEIYPILHELNTPPILLQSAHVVWLRLRGHEMPIGKVPCSATESLLVFRAAVKTHLGGKKQPSCLALPGAFGFEKNAALVPFRMERHLKVSQIQCADESSGSAPCQIWVRPMPAPAQSSGAHSRYHNIESVPRVPPLTGAAPSFSKGGGDNAWCTPAATQPIVVEPPARGGRRRHHRHTGKAEKVPAGGKMAAEAAARRRRGRDGRAARSKRRADAVLFSGWWSPLNPALYGPSTAIARAARARQARVRAGREMGRRRAAAGAIQHFVRFHAYLQVRQGAGGRGKGGVL